MGETRPFQPDWYSAPGETIRDVLREQNISVVEFAREMGRSHLQITNLLNGRAKITTEIAERLEAILGASTDYWLTRELQYREDMARLKRGLSIVDDEEWLSKLPLNDMIKFGWLKSIPATSERMAACLDFFDVPDVAEWRRNYFDTLRSAAFRTSPSYDSELGAVAAWFRQGEIEASKIECSEWQPQKFRATLQKIRGLSRIKDPSIFVPNLQNHCADCGVAVVIVRAPSGCRASGVTRFLSAKKALILLSFRYLSDDHFWFTFFHEAGHLLLHGKKALFLEKPDMISTTEEEEANDFAANLLIPKKHKSALFALPAKYRAIIRFAQSIGISPGVVVGQLQHHGILRQNQLNSLKRRYHWANN